MNTYMENESEKTNEEECNFLKCSSINYTKLKELKEKKKLLEEKIEKEQYKCLHISLGRSVLAINDTKDGSCVCELCGQKFRPDDVSKSDIKRPISEVKNIIQTMVMLEGNIVIGTETMNTDLDMNEVSDVLLFLDKLESLFIKIDKKFYEVLQNR